MQSQPFVIEPVTLEGDAVRLEPLAEAHIPALCEAGLNPSLWEWTTSRVATPEEMAAYVRAALAAQDRGAALPFATIERASGRVAGCTRFLNIEPAHRRLEIGATWLGCAWQRTALNTEAKYLMLRHAFEALHAIRVEFKTDTLNQISRAAIRRLGAREEGILRKHMIVWSGRFRDTVYYAITDEEWPAVKARLEERLTVHSGRN